MQNDAKKKITKERMRTAQKKVTRMLRCTASLREGTETGDGQRDCTGKRGGGGGRSWRPEEEMSSRAGSDFEVGEGAAAVGRSRSGLGHQSELG